MVQRLSRKRLDILPKSTDEYWELADTRLIDMNKSVPKCQHYIVRRFGTEVECRNCHIGFFVTPEDSVADGHLYHGGIRVI